MHHDELAGTGTGNEAYKPPLAVTTTRKNIDSYRAALYAVGKHISQLDVLPEGYKKELLKDLMEHAPQARQDGLDGHGVAVVNRQGHIINAPVRR